MTRHSPKLYSYIQARLKEFGQIPEKRKSDLLPAARYIKNQVYLDKTAKLTFICTHNSRRSQMAQIWAQTASSYFELPSVKSYSGGVEVTAFNPRAVKAISNVGFAVERTDESTNSVYLVRFSKDAEPINCFAKKYDDQSNPQKDFCALLTCSDADDACPVVFGASMRISIPYKDPKDFDGTDQVMEKYDECCAQIAREVLYLFSGVNGTND